MTGINGIVRNWDASPKQYSALLAPDYAKCFGIFLVVFAHTLQGLMTSGILSKSTAWVTLDHMIYVFHMPLFFYLSGLFIEPITRSQHFTGVVKKAVITLLIPLIAWSYLQFALQYFSHGASNIKPDLIYVLTAPFPPRQQFWFLGVLFLFMAFVSAILDQPLGKRILPAIILLDVIAIFIFGDAARQSVIAGDGIAPLFAEFILKFPYYAMGVYLTTERLKTWRAANLLCFVAFGVTLASYEYLSFENEGLHLIAATICVIAIYKIALNADSHEQEPSHGKKVIAFIGMNSMIIYLAHVIFAAAFRSFLLKYGVIDGWSHLASGVSVAMMGPLLLIPLSATLSQGRFAFFRLVVPFRLDRAHSHPVAEPPYSASAQSSLPT